MIEQGELLATTAGELLGGLRRSQNLTIADVAKHLKLQQEKIESIESNQWQKFSPACALGYARQYGQFLGVHKEQLDALIANIDCKAAPIQSAFLGDDSQPSGFIRYLRVVSYVAASVFVIIPLVWAYTHFAATWPGEQVTSNQPVSEAVEHELPLQVESVVAESLEAKTTPEHIQANMVPVFIPEDEPVPAPQAVVVPAGELEVELSADSWLHITDASGQRLEYALKAGGQLYKYQGEPPYQMQIGRVSAARIWIDGETVELPELISGGVANITVTTDTVSVSN